MAVENFKRWHWIAVGALLGPALGYAWAISGTVVEGGSDARQFERDIVLTDTASGHPLVKDIVIHPSEQDFSGKTVNVVSYKRLAKDKQGRFGWLDRRIIAPQPYKPEIGGRVATDDKMTVEKYLSEMARQFDTVRFSYGWWLEPKNAMLVGAALGIVLIGGVWPTLLNVMIGAGLGPKPQERQKIKHEWNWFKRAKPASSPMPHKPVVSAAEQQQLQDIADAYEKTLAAGATVSGGAVASESAESEAPVRKLDGTMEEPKPVQQPVEEDNIEVKGEFYPVLIHHKKPQDGSRDKK